MSHCVGLDAPQDLTAICIIDEHGTITHEPAVPTEPAKSAVFVNDATTPITTIKVLERAG